MKKVGLCFLIVAMLLCSVGFVACGGGQKKIELTLIDSISGEYIDKVEIPNDTGLYRAGTHYKGIGGISDPQKDNWFFDGWYLDKECANKVVDECGVEYRPAGNMNLYAGWSDHIEIPTNTGEGRPHPLVNEIFNAEINLSWVGASPTNIVRFYGSITARGDFTGDLSSDEIDIIIRYYWYSGESFLGEYVNPEEIVESISIRITLEKRNNFSISNLDIGENTYSYVNFYNTDPIFINTFGKAILDVNYGKIVNGEYTYVTVQYRHD
ncbi:MAG: InlB B-repeat-containing protein [Clostridiales bacterium]|jgi:uncharacterized repeat protein (TIGR02543 family)|nr:InlB B-repeat-containing protein [Clostridiales bacterium]